MFDLLAGMPLTRGHERRSCAAELDRGRVRSRRIADVDAERAVEEGRALHATLRSAPGDGFMNPGKLVK
jgi:hypothetical protein